MKRLRAGSLRREIVRWYSLTLLISLGLFALVTFLLLRQALERSGRASLRQSAEAVENIYVPPGIPRLATREEILRLRSGVQVVRRRTLLATGDTVETWFSRSDDTESRALRSFLLISLLLIPLTAALAALGGRALIERLLDPLRRLVDATREIGIGDLSRRVSEPERPEELADLARAFNGMLTRLEQAVHALSRFTADASHELRTPLTGIKGTVQVALQRRRDADELEETLAEVLEETEWMLHLVDGLLTLARGEEGLVSLARERVDLAALLADVCEVGEALALDREVEVRLEAPEPLVIEGSPGPLRQVFLNLVSNAVKFTAQGRVTVRAEAGGEEVVVRVIDTGSGIGPEEIPRVFDRFYRGDTARARPGGTGLGLAIARLLVEQHGGRIEVESEVGAGSEFRVHLPVSAEAAALLAAAPAREGEDGRAP